MTTKPLDWRVRGLTDDQHQREQALRQKAERVMAELRATGEGWEAAWQTHPVAVAYRALLREVWRP